MGVLSDRQICERVKLPESDPNRLRIEGFQSKLVRKAKCPSWGLSCYGYDFKLGNQFKWVDATAVAQGKGYIEAGDDTPWIEKEGSLIVIPAGGFVLSQTLEWVRIPRDCKAAVFGKSTIARLGIDLNTTPLEPEWEGLVTLEITNSNNVPVCLHAGHGICQVIFYRADDPDGTGALETSYADRVNPLYQGQISVTTSRVDS